MAPHRRESSSKHSEDRLSTSAVTDHRSRFHALALVRHERARLRQLSTLQRLEAEFRDRKAHVKLIEMNIYTAQYTVIIVRSSALSHIKVLIGITETDLY